MTREVPERTTHPPRFGGFQAMNFELSGFEGFVNLIVELPFGNQTWQWKIPHLWMTFPAINLHVSSMFEKPGGFS